LSGERLVVIKKTFLLYYDAFSLSFSIVASAIFADGAAAAIIGCNDDNDDTNVECAPIWTMEDQRAQGIPDSVASMAWDLGNSGWRVGNNDNNVFSIEGF
jgi:predicted naringenin-chalcone synthase